MQTDVYDLLQDRPDLLNVVRYNPHWYRLLTREPENISDLQKSAKYFYGKTWTQRIEKANQSADMLNMLLSMAELTKD